MLPSKACNLVGRSTHETFFSPLWPISFYSGASALFFFSFFVFLFLQTHSIYPLPIICNVPSNPIIYCPYLNYLSLEVSAKAIISLWILHTHPPFSTYNPRVSTYLLFLASHTCFLQVDIQRLSHKVFTLKFYILFKTVATSAYVLVSRSTISNSSCYYPRQKFHDHSLRALACVISA